MVGTTIMDGFPAFEVVQIPAVSSGYVYKSKLSQPIGVQISMRDVSGGTAAISYALSGQSITMTTSFTSGTADLLITGRL